MLSHENAFFEGELFLTLVMYLHIQGAQDKKKAKLYGKMGKQIITVYVTVHPFFFPSNPCIFYFYFKSQPDHMGTGLYHHFALGNRAITINVSECIHVFKCPPFVVELTCLSLERSGLRLAIRILTVV